MRCQSAAILHSVLLSALAAKTQSVASNGHTNAAFHWPQIEISGAFLDQLLRTSLTFTDFYKRRFMSLLQTRDASAENPENNPTDLWPICHRLVVEVFSDSLVLRANVYGRTCDLSQVLYLNFLFAA